MDRVGSLLPAVRRSRRTGGAFIFIFYFFFWGPDESRRLLRLAERLQDGPRGFRLDGPAQRIRQLQPLSARPYSGLWNDRVDAARASRDPSRVAVAEARPGWLQCKPTALGGLDEGGPGPRDPTPPAPQVSTRLSERARPEKGVDVNLAVAVIEHLLTASCDVAIIFSHDTDLVPVPEAIGRLSGTAQVETASWQSPAFNRRLRPQPPVYHHYAPQQVFEQVETRVNYAHGQ